MKKIGILGYGTIGSGVAAAFRQNRDRIELLAGEPVEVWRILDLRDFPGDPMESRVTHVSDELLNDPEIDIVVETMGGLHPAYEFVKQALENGKSVVTSNKLLVEAKGAELGRVAAEHGVAYLFEGSVGGCIPIVRALNTCVAQDDVLQIHGILNGTTNFILMQMESEGSSFEEALAEAQRRGYAERNPEADVDGLDAARKIAILASMQCGKHVPFEEVPTQGIRMIDLADLAAARSLGGRIKLVGSFVHERGDVSNIYMSVMPMFIPRERMLSGVDGVYNAVQVTSNLMGDSVYYGKGAGKMSTASAVVADILAILEGKGPKEMHLWSEEIMHPLPLSKRTGSYMLRMKIASTDITEVLMRLREHPLLRRVMMVGDSYTTLTRDCNEEDLESLTEALSGQVQMISVYPVLPSSPVMED